MGLPEATNADLIRRCRAGDAQAWQLLVRRYARLVHAIPVRYGMAPHEVDDVGQEVFLALAQQVGQIDDPERLPAWLMTTARRIAWRHLRSRKREAPAVGADVGDSETPDGDLVMHGRVPSLHELISTWETQEVLAAGLARLNERCRALLHLLFLDSAEPSYDAVSEQLAIPKGSIGPTRNRCLAQLRSILEGLGRHAP